MRIALTAGAVIVAAVVAFLVGQNLRTGTGPPPWIDGSLIISTPNGGKSEFCNARIERQRMTGRVFVWVRRGACAPANGGYFELRPKSGNTSPLEPANPRGVHVITATVSDTAREGDVYHYELWQVLPDGKTEERLHDPEIEIGPPM
jgi:hypothetical protein